MRPINPMKTGLATGAVLGLWHFLWAMLVAAGWGQAVFDFVMRLHMIRLDVTVGPFVLATAMTLVAVTFTFAFAFGMVFALFWNRLAAPSSP